MSLRVPDVDELPHVLVLDGGEHAEGQDQAHEDQQASEAREQVSHNFTPFDFSLLSLRHDYYGTYTVLFYRGQNRMYEYSMEL